ncbi:MAG: COX15/CtaA family protein [Acidimicrobiia bacterium]
MRMHLPEMTPGLYRRVTLVAAVLLAIIIVTGGAVRLSDSGLGCPDWPTCSGGRLAPHSASDEHAMVEFVNRMFTGLVSLAVIVCVLGALRRVPRRRDLVMLAWGLVAGVFGQAVLGGLVVLFELQPPLVMAHFLLSLVLLTNAVVLCRRAGQPDAPAHAVVAPEVRTAGRLLIAVTSVVVVAGTFVTATGPHLGDKDVKPLSFNPPEVARVHGAAVIALIVGVVATLWLLRRTNAPAGVHQRLFVLLGLIIVQAAIGYIQYFNGIPEVLVGLHIAGATAIWAAVVSYYLGLSTRDEPALVESRVPPQAAIGT